MSDMTYHGRGTKAQSEGHNEEKQASAPGSPRLAVWFGRGLSHTDLRRSRLRRNEAGLEPEPSGLAYGAALVPVGLGQTPAPQPVPRCQDGSRRPHRLD